MKTFYQYINESYHDEEQEKLHNFENYEKAFLSLAHLDELRIRFDFTISKTIIYYVYGNQRFFKYSSGSKFDSGDYMYLSSEFKRDLINRIGLDSNRNMDSVILLSVIKKLFKKTEIDLIYLRF